MFRSLGLLCLGLCLIHPVWGHSEYKARYVATTGQDTGACDSPVRPCKTIAYAAARATKGERVFVAAGNYSFEDPLDLFYLTSGSVQAYGGYNRFEHFQKQQPQKNPTRLIGVPLAYREFLEDRGFQIVADGKSQISKSDLDEFVAQRQSIQESKAAADCIGGFADQFQCSGIGLLSQTSISDLGGSGPGTAANDVWGFVDLNDQREYAIIGVNVATAVVDVTQPDEPRVVGTIPGTNTVWRDIKVFQFFDQSQSRWMAYAYVTADGVNDGLLVIDLTQLPNEISLANRISSEASAHNVYISNLDYATGLVLNNEQPVLYTAGANLSGGAFRGYSLQNPESPAFIGTGGGGYMHDASSLIIDDSRRDTQCANPTDVCQVLVDFNETSFALWDVTNSGNPVQLSDQNYPNVNYVHSGWWSEDKQFVFVQDELDELNANLNTTLRVFDVSDLLNPVMATTWTGPTAAIDHNGFVHGNRYYMSNYERGITVLNITDPTNLSTAGFFDTFPSSNRAAFNGAWGAYPYLPSGNILVSDDMSGLFVLSDNTLASSFGTLSFDQTSYGVTEGNTILLTVNRLNGSNGSISVDYQTLSGSTDAADLTSATGTLSWGPGDTTPQTISIPVASDGATEGLERFKVDLSNPTNGATLGESQTSVFISDPASTAEIRFLQSSVTTNDSAGQVFVTVVRAGSAQGAVSVDFETVPGTAIQDSDFVAVSGTLSWSDGDATGRTIAVPILEDTDTAASEQFSISLSNPAGAALVSNSLAVTIGESNQAPFANAGPNLSGNEGVTITLSAGASTDPDGDNLSYQWVQTGGPAIALSDPTSVSMTVPLPEVSATSVVTVQLTVADPSGLTDTDEVNITINDTDTGSGGGGGGPIDWVLLVCVLLLLRRQRTNHAPVATRPISV